MWCMPVLTTGKCLLAAGPHSACHSTPARSLWPTGSSFGWLVGSVAMCYVPQPGGCSHAHQTETWSCAHLPHQERQQRGCLPGARDSGWDKWQVWGNDRRKLITFNHINGCRFQKLLQMFTPADEMLCRLCQILEVSERDDMPESECANTMAKPAVTRGKEHCSELSTSERGSRNSCFRGLGNFLYLMGIDLAKDVACSIPSELPRQLMFQNYTKLKYLAIWLFFVMINLIP